MGVSYERGTPVEGSVPRFRVSRAEYENTAPCRMTGVTLHSPIILHGVVSPDRGASTSLLAALYEVEIESIRQHILLDVQAAVLVLVVRERHTNLSLSPGWLPAAQ